MSLRDMLVLHKLPKRIGSFLPSLQAKIHPNYLRKHTEKTPIQNQVTYSFLLTDRVTYNISISIYRYQAGCVQVFNKCVYLFSKYSPCSFCNVDQCPCYVDLCIMKIEVICDMEFFGTQYLRCLYSGVGCVRLFFKKLIQHMYGWNKLASCTSTRGEGGTR